MMFGMPNPMQPLGAAAVVKPQMDYFTLMRQNMMPELMQYMQEPTRESAQKSLDQIYATRQAAMPPGGFVGPDQLGGPHPFPGQSGVPGGMVPNLTQPVAPGAMGTAPPIVDAVQPFLSPEEQAANLAMINQALQGAMQGRPQPALPALAAAFGGPSLGGGPQIPPAVPRPGEEPPEPIPEPQPEPEPAVAPPPAQPVPLRQDIAQWANNARRQKGGAPKALSAKQTQWLRSNQVSAADAAYLGAAMANQQRLRDLFNQG